MEWVSANYWNRCPLSVECAGGHLFTDLPVLVLDDEADHASINTKAVVLGLDGKPVPEQEATAINFRIRELLRMFARSVYVGYTATPFANVFIHPYVNSSAIGRDLFPRHFILNLPAPSNYVGPVQVFGLGEDTDSELDRTGLPTIRIIEDYEEDLPQDHDKDHTVGALPASLRHAMRAFILACAIRAFRDKRSSHNSMLVHVTRFVHVQDQVADLIEEELIATRNRIMFGDGGRSEHILDELQAIFLSDFEPTSSEVRRLVDDPEIFDTRWSDVEPLLREAVSRITVKKINGTAKDVLDYYGNPDGISVIAVGGDKLSRGLTLEGLSVSYYLRASRMYDTLMQMGRWFGYRPGYADLCRLYTTEELVGWYRHITIASEELRRDFDEMVRSGRTPEDFGLKVRAHPGSLIITGAGKLQNHTPMRVSFSDRLIESYRISSAKSDQRANYLALGSLIGGLGAPGPLRPHYLWHEVLHDRITGFLRDLMGYHGAFDFAPGRLADFIDNLVGAAELTSWNVCLINIARNKGTSIAGLTVGYSERTPEAGEPGQIQIKRRHIISMDHEWLDIGESGKAEALEMWRRENAASAETPNPGALTGKWARRVRGKEHGLLLLYLLDPTAEGLPAGNQDQPYLGYALSFPVSERGDELAISYMVNSIYAEEEFEDE